MLQSARLLTLLTLSLIAPRASGISTQDAPPDANINIAQEPAARVPQDTTAQDTTAQDTTTTGAPVEVLGQTLFFVRERVLSFSPEDRARAIAARIEAIYRDPFVRLDSLGVVEAEGATEILAGDRMIMTVTDRDARAEGRPRAELAAEYASIIRATLLSLRHQYSLRAILLATLYSVMTLATLAALLFILARIFPAVYGKLDAWRDRRIPALRIQRFTLASSSSVTNGLIWLAKAVRVVASIVLIYLALTLVLGFFPWTRDYAATIIRYVAVPLRHVAKGLADYLPNLFFIAVILAVTYYLIKFVKLIFREIGRGTIVVPGFYHEWARPTYKISRFLIIVFTAIAIFPYLPGAGSEAFKGISLFLGVVFSLGSTSAIANIVAGVVLTYTRAFEEGDRVKIADTVGDVTDRTLLATHIRTTKNVDITVPNAMVLGSHIINYSTSARTGLILHTAVTIGYDVPWRKVHELLLAAAGSTANVTEDPPPFVLQTALDDSYVSYELNAYTNRPKLMTGTYSELHQNIQDKFNEAGVEIMSPRYSAIRDGNRATNPADYLPKGYEPPGFRFRRVDGERQ
ncbi:MAG: mechanosensitive ion channel family protein [Gemmatimonadota bacterium]|nr:MAG: mechanosensitive ion channel family protein [Gemmatimonadota bacterium]